MSAHDEANIDAADIDADSTPPPAGWTPDITDDTPDAADVRDLDKEADA